MRLTWHTIVRIALLVTVFSTMSLAQDGEHVRLVGRWYRGASYTVVVDSNIAYVGNGGSLDIMDVSDPASPVLLSQVETASTVHHVQLADSFAYVAAGSAGFWIINVSNPLSPTVVGTFGFTDPVWDLCVTGGYAYVVTYGFESNLHFIDVSTPSSPVEVGIWHYISGSEVGGIFISGNYAFLVVGGMHGSLISIDVSDPNNPKEVDSYGMDGGFWDLFLYSSYAYVKAGGGEHVIIFDVSDPTWLRRVGAFGYGSKTYAADDTAYVVGDSGLYIYDVSDPSAPIKIGGEYLDDSRRRYDDVYVSNGFAYLASQEGGLRIVDVRQPDIHVTEVRPFDMPPGEARGVYVADGHAYIANGYGGLQVLDISNPAIPDWVGGLPVGESAWNVQVTDSFAYVLNDNWLSIIDVSDPTTPVVRSYTSGGDSESSVFVSQGYAYVPVSNALRIIDVRNPDSAQVIAFLDRGAEVNDVYVSGNYAYWTGHDNLRILDVSDPTSPTSVGVYTENTGEALWVEANYAYVVGDDAPMQVIDVSDPTNPVHVTYLDTSFDAKDISIANGLAYVISKNGNLHIIDVHTPTNLEQVGFYTPTHSFAMVFATEQYAYIAAGSGGIYILEYDIIAVTVPGPILPSSFILQQNYPNPFNITTVISYTLPAAQVVTLKVYDVLGWEVTVLVDGPQAAGEHKIAFDGSLLPSGIYLYRLTADRHVQTRKLLLLK